MAARKRNIIDYQQLNSLSSVVLYNTAPKMKRKVLPSAYIVERIICRRRMKHDYEYLIKWDGWPLNSCTWEPSNHLSAELLRGYEMPPSPHHARLEVACRQFYQGIITSLRSKSTAPYYVEMDLDMWRYIINGKGIESDHKGFWMYSIKDMCRLKLPEHWWYTLDLHGEGRAVLPPLKIKPVLSWTRKHQIVNLDGILTQAPQMPIEKICVDILRRPCNINNLQI